jgi:two-component system, LytTR family, response regulator
VTFPEVCDNGNLAKGDGRSNDCTEGDGPNRELHRRRAARYGRRAALRILVVGDEPLGRERLCTLLASESDCETTYCSSGAEALARLREHGFDVMFLDVELPELDGFGLVAALPPWGRPHLVFVTAHEAHAVRAFAVRALDYLLKPFDRLRFAETLARVREARGRDVSAAPRLAVKVADGVTIFVALADIDWIAAASNYVEVHVGAASHLVRHTLSEMEAMLPAATFGRVHRGAIVNVDAIRELRNGVGREAYLVVRSGATVPVGKNFRSGLEARLRLVR